MSDKEKHESTGSWAGGEKTADPVTPVFDEGEHKPTPIQSTGDDGVRGVAPVTPAGQPGAPSDEAKKHTAATMPPGEGRDPKRNSM